MPNLVIKDDHAQEQELLLCRNLFLQLLQREEMKNSTTITSISSGSAGGSDGGGRRKKKRFTLLESESIGALVTLYSIESIMLLLRISRDPSSSSSTCSMRKKRWEKESSNKGDDDDNNNGNNEDMDDNHESVPVSAIDGGNEYANRLLDYHGQIESHLSCHECEVLYGRAGYLQSIAYIRQTISHSHNHRKQNDNDKKRCASMPLPSPLFDVSFGRDIVMKVIESILTEGQRIASKYDHVLTLMWEWHGRVYLGSAHGIVGILHRLLHFVPEIKELSCWKKKQQGRQEQKKVTNLEVYDVDHVDCLECLDYFDLIQNTIQQLGSKMCFESLGNLASSYYPNDFL